MHFYFNSYYQFSPQKAVSLPPKQECPFSHCQYPTSITRYIDQCFYLAFLSEWSCWIFSKWFFPLFKITYWHKQNFSSNVLISWIMSRFHGIELYLYFFDKPFLVNIHNLSIHCCIQFANIVFRILENVCICIPVHTCAYVNSTSVYTIVPRFKLTLTDLRCVSFIRWTGKLSIFFNAQYFEKHKKYSFTIK